MRITFGKLVRRYVYDVRLGERKVSALYLGDKKIWPTLSDTVYSCVLDVAAVEGAAPWAYWLHALDAVSRGVGSECYMKLRAGGREYMLGATFGNWYLAEYDGRATVVFGDNGPLWEKLQPGDEVSVELCVPARESASMAEGIGAEVSEVFSLPWLPGTGLGFTVGKMHKRMNAQWEFSVVGMGSGRVHLGGWNVVEGHSRCDYAYALYARGGEAVRDFVWDDVYHAGDVGLGVCLRGVNGGTKLADGRLLWPGFRRSVKFRVSAVVRHG